MQKPRAIIFDLDGTLCQLKSYEIRHLHTGDEKRIENMLEIAYSLFMDFHIIVLTGRKEKEYGDVTNKWLENNFGMYNELIMQEGSTAKKNHIFKREELIKLKERYDIVALFDDNPDLIPVCKELGILLLQVHN